MYVCRDVTERRRLELDYELLSLTWERRLEERTNQLRDNRDRYRRYVEGLRGEYLFYATAPDGTVTYVSPSVYAILGYAPEQVVGRNWREFVDPHDPMFARLEEFERMRFAGATTPPFILAPVRHASGETRMLEFTDSQLADADGRIVANEGICRDITQRLAAEDALRGAREELELRVSQRTAELTAANDCLRESEQRYRSVVDDQFEFIIRWRDDGVRTFVNESYCRHCGQAREDLIGSSFMPEILEDDRAALRQKLTTLSLESPALVFEHRVVLANRRFQWQRWTHRALFDKQGSFIEFQSVGTDVTDRRKQEELAHERVVAGVQMQNLSDRERDVMRLVVLGDANKVIARKLGLSIKTIEKHRSSLMKKLRVRSVPELVRLALLAGDDEVH
jgi:PAS domain S-box-containing protein